MKSPNSSGLPHNSTWYTGSKVVSGNPGFKAGNKALPTGVIIFLKILKVASIS